MSKINKSVLITDLDNTLFDWVGLWYACFEPMLHNISEISEIDLDVLKNEAKAIHQKHGTSEYSFLIEELPSLKNKYGDEAVVSHFKSAIDIYRKKRREHLKLYSTVAESLLKVKGTGAKIIGYTESMGFYSNYRVRRLGLDGVFDIIFSPRDHDIPKGIKKEDIRKYPSENYEFKFTKHEYTPAGELKPNKHILTTIITTLGAKPSDCVYIGDSLMKDVAMAKDAGVADVWAKYGTSQETRGYQLLREVTHWTDEQVKREKEISQRDIVPSITLKDSFSELFDYFKFGDAGSYYDLQTIPNPTDEEKKNIVEIWKEIVGVQKHFNDISLGIRGLFITLILALFAATGFLLDKSLKMSFGGFVITYATLMPILGVFATWLFYFIDRYWYHRLLVGSVNQGLYIERKYRDVLPELSLTDAIGAASPIKLSSCLPKLLAAITVKDGKYISEKQLHSTGKIELFYKPITYVFCGLFLILAISGGASYQGRSIPDWLGFSSTTDKFSVLPEIKLENKAPGTYNLEIKLAPQSQPTKSGVTNAPTPASPRPNLLESKGTSAPPSTASPSE